jgi:hypothetical protein
MRDPDPELRALHADIKRLAETAERLREDNRTLQEVGNAAVSGLKSGDYTQLRNLLTDELS